ncbi:hypothetical protein [Roseibium album]|uniref:hypothetical protein n=1 Tax=Roseibium album TaxID=311410 RepID=UPI00248FE007|nr:hypothetical protein [Roseibium album]
MWKNKWSTNWISALLRLICQALEVLCRRVARGGACWANGWNALGDRCRAAAKA